MNNIPRMMSHFAAVAGFAMALWIASPASAAEINAPGKQTAGLAGARTAAAPVKHHHFWPRYRVASWYSSRFQTDASFSGRPCSWWCGRPVLLMVGIAY
jgi:transposase